MSFAAKIGEQEVRDPAAITRVFIEESVKEARKNRQGFIVLYRHADGTKDYFNQNDAIIPPPRPGTSAEFIPNPTYRAPDE